MWQTVKSCSINRKQLDTVNPSVKQPFLWHWATFHFLSHSLFTHQQYTANYYKLNNVLSFVSSTLLFIALTMVTQREVDVFQKPFTFQFNLTGQTMVCFSNPVYSKGLSLVWLALNKQPGSYIVITGFVTLLQLQNSILSLSLSLSPHPLLLLTKRYSRVLLMDKGLFHLLQKIKAISMIQLSLLHCTLSPAQAQKWPYSVWPLTGNREKALGPQFQETKQRPLILLLPKAPVTSATVVFTFSSSTETRLKLCILFSLFTGRFFFKTKSNLVEEARICPHHVSQRAAWWENSNEAPADSFLFVT